MSATELAVPTITDALAQAASRRETETAEVDDGRELVIGVDLGTAATVLVATTHEGWPELVLAHPSQALRDGVVVDFVGASEVVAMLRRRAQDILRRPLQSAVTAYPPGSHPSDQATCRFVLERAGFDHADLTDEVSAAQTLLQIEDGVIVDVGGGSTGVGIYRSGDLVAIDDRPGGGHYLDLILAGAHKMSIQDAEQSKRDDGAKHLPVLIPGIQRIAEAIRSMTVGHEELPVHVVGGGLQIPGAVAIVEEHLQRTTMTYPHADLVTPLGIASVGS